jgi:2,4-dienoyl-CoA reductase-like NADH-dependent reductase (Old Yellow Enzyme family)/thioredoxin reductase
MMSSLTATPELAIGSARLNDPLLTPLRIKHLVLKNRIVSTSHAAGLTEDEYPQERYQRYHEEKAIGGIGMSMFGGSSNIGPDSANTFGQINIGNDGIIPHLQRFSERMHKHGAALMCQITHLGRRSTPYGSDWLAPIGPSRVRETLHRGIPREMNDHDIERVIGYYGQAARRCKEGGLDGLETLAGGHLLGQFLDPSVNLRTDRFGGSLENRCRFILMVHEEIRRQVGDDFIVGFRYAIEDGVDFDQSVAAARILEQSGLFDFFNVVYGRMDTGNTLVVNNMPTMSMPSAPWLQKAAAFKRAVSLPVIHAAKIADLATARYAISEGLLDLVGMTRAHMADPHLVVKFAQGKEDQVRPCVGASFCRGHQSACIHNPSTGRETWLAHEVDRSTGPARKVVVVGGGVAGLEAARVAALRGHDVVLLEASPKLGGQVLLATAATWRKDLVGIVDWRAAELERLGVDVRTNVYADEHDVLALQPDVIIVATGGVPDMESVPGAEHATSVFDALTDRAPTAGRALVYDGTGRHNAFVCAERYAMAGVSVTLAMIDGNIGAELGGRGDEIVWRRRLSELGIETRNDMRLMDVKREGAKRRAVLRHELTGVVQELEVDAVVIENGTLPVCEIFDALVAQSSNDGEVDIDALLSGAPQPWQASAGKSFALYRIGDASTSRDIHAAVYEAFRLCRCL